MHFDIRHRFEGASVERVESLYLLDDAFNVEAFAAIRYERTLLRRSTEGSRFHREVRIVPRGAIPAPLAALAPGGGVHMDEFIDYDLARHAGTWRVVPSFTPGEFRSEGTFSIAAEDGGAVFAMEGDTTVKVPLVGSVVTKHAVAMAVAGHESLARAVRARLSSGGG